jgi:hypothetical protein
MSAHQLSAWDNTIFRVQVGDRLDLPGLLAEVHSTLVVTDTPSAADKETPFQIEECPIFAQTRRELIIPMAAHYLRNIWGYEGGIEYENHHSWPLAYSDGRGLEVHNHPTSHLTSVLYLACSGEEDDSELVLLDPRSHAGRSYPEALRKSQFASLRIRPRVGELLVFPSYIAHYVAPGRSSKRVSVNTDHHYELHE